MRILSMNKEKQGSAGVKSDNPRLIIYPQKHESNWFMNCSRIVL